MTLLRGESFGALADGAHVEGDADFAGDVWTQQVGEWTAVDLGNGRKYVYASHFGDQAKLVMSVPDSPATIFLGATLHNLAPLEYPVRLFTFTGTGAKVAGSVWLDTDGKLAYYRQEAEVNEVLRSESGIGAGQSVNWTIKVVFHNSAGTVEFYREGVLDASISGVDTVYDGDFSALASLTVLNSIRVLKVGFSDLWLDDATNHGAADVLCEMADTAGSSSEFTPTGDTNNEDCVDEVGSDEDATYNRSTTNGDLDQLTHSGASDIQEVLAVIPFVRARKEAGGTNTLKVGCLHSGTHSQGPDRGLSEGYQYYSEIHEDVPGGSGWTVGQLAAAETTYENTT